MIAAVVNIFKNAMTSTADDVEHVVILCRDPRVRDLLHSWLNHGLIDVEITQTAEDARWALAKRHYHKHILITDRVFPPWPGLPALTDLRASVPDLRVVVIQDGSADASAVAKAAGADAGLGRPLNRRALFEALGHEPPETD